MNSKRNMGIYIILWISFLSNVVNSQCTEGVDHLYHKVCYPSAQMNHTTLLTAYNTTFDSFTPLQDHIYTALTGTDCVTLSKPSSVPRGNTCFACCIANISSQENGETLEDEYTKWRLLFQLNENLFNFVDDLIINGGVEPSYIFYAQSDSIISPTACPTATHPPPRICNYPFSDEFTLTLSLNTTNDNVNFQVTKDNPQGWAGIGLGPMDNLAYAIIASTDVVPTPSITGVSVNEWILEGHINVSDPTAVNVTLDPTSSSDILSAEIIFNGISLTAEFTRDYTFNQNGIITQQFTDNSSLIEVYAAWAGNLQTQVALGHQSGGNVPAKFLHIIPMNPETYWCNDTEGIDCTNTFDIDCCRQATAIVTTIAPTTVTPTETPTQLPAKTPLGLCCACTTANTTRQGCPADPTCQHIVCYKPPNNDSFCCAPDGTWDVMCATRAEQICNSNMNYTTPQPTLTISPTKNPTLSPTLPTKTPTKTPTLSPTLSPTKTPTLKPSTGPLDSTCCDCKIPFEPCDDTTCKLIVCEPPLASCCVPPGATWKQECADKAAEICPFNETKEIYKTQQDNTWMIVSIVFICLFVMAIAVIVYLIMRITCRA